MQRPSWILLTLACISVAAVGVLLTLLVTHGRGDRSSAIAAATGAARAGENTPEESGARPATSSVVPLRGAHEDGSERVVDPDLNETSNSAGEIRGAAIVGAEESLQTGAVGSSEEVGMPRLYRRCPRDRAAGERRPVGEPGRLSQ